MYIHFHPNPTNSAQYPCRQNLNPTGEKVAEQTHYGAGDGAGKSRAAPAQTK